MAMTALIVDDERLAREELKYLLDSAGGVEVIAQGENGIVPVDAKVTHGTTGGCDCNYLRDPSKNQMPTSANGTTLAIFSFLFLIASL